METFELILFLLTAVIASSILDKFLPPLSLPLVQIALGAALALAVPTPLEWGIDPELLLILFIAPLHFNESRHVDSGALWKNRWGIASLSVGLVFASRLCGGRASRRSSRLTAMMSCTFSRDRRRAAIAMPSTDRTRFCCSGARAAGSIRQSSMPAPTVAGASPCARAPVP